MFINSQGSRVGLLSPEKLANSAVIAGGLSQASGSVSGIIQAIGTVFVGLIGAPVNALSERLLAGVKMSLVIAAIGGLGWPARSTLRADLDDANWIADGDNNNLIGE
jgi:hypothetical protein